MKTFKSLSIYNFSGFYESIWYNSDSLYYAADYFETPGTEYDINFNEYTSAVARAFFDQYEYNILELFTPGLISLEYAGVWSPKYYNFETDEILYNLEISDLEKFNSESLGLIEFYKTDLTEYLKSRFTSCDGFISFYSAKIEDWINDIKTGEIEGLQLAVLIDFFIKNKDPEVEYQIYDIITGNGYNIESFMYAVNTAD